MTRQELAKELYKASYLTGNFTLRSGQTSTEYFDKYQFEGQPHLLKSIASHLKASVPPTTNLLAGLEMGGIPIATALSFETGIHQCLVRKEAKTYGTCKLAEGQEIKGKELCIIEDVVTTGGQLLKSARELRSRGAIIKHALCVIYRGPKVADLSNFSDSGIALTPLFTANDLKS